MRTKGLKVLGYSTILLPKLVGCCVAGINAFFVREDLVGDLFCTPFTAENHYEPPRYYLGSRAAGHLRSAID